MWKEELARLIYPPVFKTVIEQDILINDLSQALSSCREDYLVQEKKAETYRKREQECTAKLESLEPVQHPVERYGLDFYKEIPNKKYRAKRIDGTEPVDLFINEMITPGAFEVLKFKRRLSRGDLNIQQYAKKVGNAVAARIKWTADKQFTSHSDYWLYPSELLATGIGDCEDHTYLVCSISPEDFGWAFGFYINNAGKREAHAFNVFVDHRKLYILDTVSNTAAIYEYGSDECPYEIYLMGTIDKTFEVKKGVSFGVEAKWT